MMLYTVFIAFFVFQSKVYQKNMGSPGCQSLCFLFLYVDRYKLYHIMLYRVHLAWVGFKLTMLVVICTDCIGSCKSNYHTITTMRSSFWSFSRSPINLQISGCWSHFDHLIKYIMGSPGCQSLCFLFLYVDRLFFNQFWWLFVLAL
jgi:hypothetical protein